jgi:hypothetical protein
MIMEKSRFFEKNFKKMQKKFLRRVFGTNSLRIYHHITTYITIYQHIMLFHAISCNSPKITPETP